MQIDIHTVSEVQQEADIEVSPEELKPLFDQAYERYRPKVELRGFRKGKVPLPMVKQLYGEAIEHEALDTIADDFYRKAMAEKNIRPIGQPALVDIDFKRGERLRFKIKYEVRPEIGLKKYRGISVERPVHPVTDSEVDAEIDHLRRLNSTNAEAAAASDEDHIVTGDLQEMDKTGAPLIGKKTSRARFFLWDQTLAQPIRDALRGATVGGTYRATFETGEGDQKESTHVAITVTKIEKVNVPPFDETLVKKITGDKVSSPDEFRTNLRKDLERYWQGQAEGKVGDALADEVVRLHEFPVPDSLVEGFLDAFVDDVRSRSKDKKLPPQFDEKKFREENRTFAVWQAKWMLLKERIAEAEKLTVSEEEIERLAESESARTGIEKGRLEQYYKSSKSATDRLLSDKIVSFLKEHAKITDKIVT